MTHHQITQMLWCALLAGLGLSVFLLDIALPLGGSACMLYVAVVVLAMHTLRWEYTRRLAYGCSGLILLGFLCVRAGQARWIEITNRLLVLGVLWVSVLCLRSRRANHAVAQHTREPAPSTAELSADGVAREAGSLRQQRDWLDGTLTSLGERSEERRVGKECRL